MEKFDAALRDHLVPYNRIDTQSEETSHSTTSPPLQNDLLSMLQQKLKEIGAREVHLTDYSTMLATILGNTKEPTIGFLAYVDRARSSTRPM